jgi:hypothetical protein
MTHCVEFLERPSRHAEWSRYSLDLIKKVVDQFLLILELAVRPGSA